MVNFFDPFEQFSLISFSGYFACSYGFPVHSLLNIYYSFSLYNFLFIFLLVNSQKVLNHNKLQFIMVSLFDFVMDILRFSILLKKYFILPLFFMVFLFILINNICGMMPYVFTTTSHFIITLFISMSIFFGNTLIGVLLHNEKIFKLFLPEGVPVFIIPLLVPIEVISYCSRIFSLAIRLFANMMAGHVLLKILISFIFALGSGSVVHWYWLWLPLSVVFCIIILEFLIAFLQAYVFLVLITAYLNDVVYLH